MSLTNWLEQPDLKTATVKVPEWGEDASIELQEMSVAVRADFETDVMGRGLYLEDNKVNEAQWRKQWQSLVVAYSLKNTDGMLRTDIADKLMTKNGRIIRRLYLQADKLSLVSSEAHEDAAKN